MSQPFLGEIRIFAGNFAPQGWANCDGQILSIAQHTALFSLLGTNYGGDGIQTFALPDLRGRAPMHQGNGAGLSPRVVGEMAGESTVVLNSTQLPQHNHAAMCNTAVGTSNSSTNNVWADTGQRSRAVYSPPPANATMNPQSLGGAGSNSPHNNMQPYLTVTFIIALAGIFPSRN